MFEGASSAASLGPGGGSGAASGGRMLMGGGVVPEESGSGHGQVCTDPTGKGVPGESRLTQGSTIGGRGE